MSKVTRNGRSSAGMSPGAAEANPGINDGSREENAHGVSRDNRVPLGGSVQTLTISTKLRERLANENKHLHYVLDDDRGRLQQVKNAGYEHVADEKGNNIYRTSGGRMQYLMAIPNDWHEDDKRLKRKRAAGNLGTEAAIGDNEYSPTKSESAVTSKTSDSILG